MRNLLLTLVIVVFAGTAFGQIQGIQKNSSISERIYFGGGLDLQFNSFIALVGASPSVGYMVTQSTSPGFGITYQWIQDRFTKENTDVYGYRFFIRQNLFSQLFAYAEYEFLSYRQDTWNRESDRFWVRNPYVGGGWYQPFNDRAGFQIIALYNLGLANRANAIGQSPWIFRSGFTYSPF